MAMTVVMAVGCSYERVRVGEHACVRACMSVDRQGKSNALMMTNFIIFFAAGLTFVHDTTLW